jgi:putative ABC transport system permease protein
VRLLRRALVRDARERRAQIAAIVATILLGVALFGASFDAFQNLTASYGGLYRDLDFADLTVVGGPSESVAGAASVVTGVAAVATRTVADTPMDVGDRRFLGRIVGQPAGGEPAVNRVRLLRGSGLDPGRPDGVLIEQHLASNFALEPGDTLRILGADGWRNASVLGVVASAEYLWPARSRQEVLVPGDEFGVVFAADAFAAASPPGTTHTEALVRLAANAPDGTLDRVTDAVIAAGGASTITRADQASNAALQEDVSGFGELSLAFPLLFLGAGAIAMAVLLGRLVASQRSRIGVLRAAGFSRRTILGHYLGLGVAVGLAGSIPGAILGAVAAAAITGLYTGVLAIPSSVVEVRPLTLAIGVLIGPLAGAAAAIGPARRAANTDPAEAMRGDVPIGRGGVSIAERLLPPLRRLPTRWRVALRGLGRNRRRAASTIFGVALATSLIFVSWAMVDTIEILLDRQFVQIERADATVVLGAPVEANGIEAAVSTEGILAAEPQLQVPAALVAGDHRYQTSVVGLRGDTTMRDLIDGSGQPLALEDGGIILGTALRNTLGVNVGDAVRIEPTADSGAASAAPGITLRVTGFVDEPLGSYAYSTLGDAAAAIGQDRADPLVSTALVRYAVGTDRGAIRNRLAALPLVAAVVDSRSLYDTAQQFLGLFYAFIGVMLVLGGLMAFALIFNTLSANVIERSVELTALRTLGMASATVGRLVTAENLLLTIVGLVPGLIASYVMAAIFMASFSSDLFQFDLAVRPTTFVGTAIAIVLVALLSQWPSLRAVRRLDLARVVRERPS